MKQAKNIDEYIADFPEDVQAQLQSIREAIQKTAPEATEAIKYGIPTFILNGNLVHFGGYKKHIGFYPAPMGIEAFAEETAQYRAGKGTLQFPFDKPMPLDLIDRIVRHRVEKNLAKKKK
ncbi:iron chaperone [Mucilaginibacter ximonensis]|uniref:Iron chaperone n=1 Tax=Mucilaginibacter ximonensis TaxID=538021 RepID=A0ABW5YHY4_9SPHI